MILNVDLPEPETKQVQLQLSQPEHKQWGQARRILCVRPDSLGDLLMTTPAFRALKNLPHHPHLTLLASSSGASIAPLIPELDQTWLADMAWLKHTPHRSNSAYETDLIRRIRLGNFDACVIFTVLTQNPLPTALLCYLADVPLRLAYCRENPYQLLTDWVQDRETIDTARHEVQRQLNLVAHIGAHTSDDRLGLRISRSAQHAIDAWLYDHQLISARWCVLHPGATAQSRRYPPERWGQVARQLDALGVRCVITGSSAEWNMAELIAAACQSAINVAGKFNLEQLASLIAAAPLLLCGNTGPAHLAAAVGTPVVDVYALTNPQHTPWRVAHRVLNFDVPCRNCLKSQCPQVHHACLLGVDPAQVVQAAQELWPAISPQSDALGRDPLCTH